MTPARQAELIAKHGAFYLALYTGERPPRSPAQQHFVKNVRSGQSTNEHELTFLMWLAHNPKFKNKKAVDDRPTSDSNSLNCQGTNTQLSEADLLFCKELYDGFRMPETEEQDSFARNVQNGVATNNHERAFLKWLDPTLTPKTTPTSKPKPSLKSKPKSSRKATDYLQQGAALTQSDLIFCKKLYEGELTPKTDRQHAFIRNVRRGAATTNHELAFLKWLKQRAARQASQSRSKRAQNQGFRGKRTRPAYKHTTKEEWKLGWRTPDDMKGDWEPSKLSNQKSPDSEDNRPRGVRAHGDPARNRANRRKDRYGRPTDQ